MSKVYLAISTDEREYENLKELTSVWDDFDGLAVTFHGSTDSDAYKLLIERKKGGFVECLPYWGQHSHDLNHILFNPTIKIFDWILLRDSAERINSKFSYNIRPFLNVLENDGINTLYQRSKLLLFRRMPHQFFTNTPHWGFHGAQPKSANIENSKLFQNDEEYCYSVRKERSKFHWVDSYMRYYLISDSNHNLLGAEHFGEPLEIFKNKENQRISFLSYIQKLGINNDILSFKKYILNNPLTLEMKTFINNIRILNDFYRFYVLSDEDLVDDIARPCKLIS